MVTKGPFMEFLRGTVSMSAITVTEDEVQTPVSRTEKMAMLIHKILFDAPEPEFDAGATNVYEMGVSKLSKSGDTAVPSYDDPDIIYRVERVSAEGIVVGAFSQTQSAPTVVTFDPPILYAKSSIFLVGRKNLAALSTASFGAAIGYTLDKVSESDFIAALVD